MMNQAALDANGKLAARFKLVRAWISAHPDAAAKLKHLDVHFKEWDEYEDQALFPVVADPTRLQGFEGELAQVEDEASKFGYVPGEHVTVGDVVDRTVGGAAAQAVSDAADAAAKAAGDAAGGALKALPWWAWPVGVGAVLGGVYVAAKGAAAYTQALLPPLVRRRIMDDEYEPRRRYRR